MSAVVRNNVHTAGTGPTAMMFAHGFGCDQNMWRHVAPAFEDRFQNRPFRPCRRGRFRPESLRSAKVLYARGLRGRCCRDRQRTRAEGRGLRRPFGECDDRPARVAQGAGHVRRLVMVGPSPRYIDDEDYVGGFKEQQIAELLDFLDDNHMGWSTAMAPVIMGNADRPELGEELTNSFCRTDPDIAKEFARVTFISDNRADLGKVTIPTLILQCSEDVIAPIAVGDYMHRQMPNSKLVVLKATGHCPNLSAPEEVISAMRGFV